MVYIAPMLEIIETETFKRWRRGLKDPQAKARIQARLRRLTLGNLGDAKPVRNGVSELRIDCGPGYRVYFMRQGLCVIVLLAGGDKSTQQTDIERAVALAEHWKE
jgi:putative addiction module killer protein